MNTQLLHVHTDALPPDMAVRSKHLISILVFKMWTKMAMFSLIIVQRSIVTIIPFDSNFEGESASRKPEQRREEIWGRRLCWCWESWGGGGQEVRLCTELQVGQKRMDFNGKDLLVFNFSFCQCWINITIMIYQHSSKQEHQMMNIFSIRNSKRTEMENQEKDNVTVDAAE